MLVENHIEYDVGEQVRNYPKHQQSDTTSSGPPNRPKRSRTDPNDGSQSNELSDLLNLIYEARRVKAHSKKEYHKNCVLIRALYDVYDMLPFDFTFQTGDIKRRGEYPVGAGCFADVWKAEWLDKAVAVKVLRMARNKKLPELKERFLKEVQIWRELVHPNVLRFMGTAEGFGSNLAMVSPWMVNGDSRSYIENHPEVDRLKLIVDVCSGVKYLHDQTPPITHGDLRGANILIDEYERGHLRDFGLANIVEENTEGSFTHIMEGNCRYLAPELIEPSVVGKRGVRPSPATDMHSLGMLMLELLTGHEPYHEIKREGTVIIQVVVRNLRPEKPVVSRPGNQELIEYLWEGLESCWSFPPAQRPSISLVSRKIVIAAKRRKLRELREARERRRATQPDSYVNDLTRGPQSVVRVASSTQTAELTENTIMSDRSTMDTTTAVENDITSSSVSKMERLLEEEFVPPITRISYELAYSDPEPTSDKPNVILPVEPMPPIGPATCLICERVFETEDFLSEHLASQGGNCTEMSLKDILASSAIEEGWQ